MARIVLIAIAVYLVFTFMFLITQAHGQDMFPAVKDGDLCIVFRDEMMKLTGERYSRQDIVVYQVDGKRYLGRIVAFEGDLVVVDQQTGRMSFNGSSQSGEVAFPTYAREGNEPVFTVPKDTLYVLGDYRTQSTDSRDFGAIPLSDVEGKLITILRRRGL
ncbi:MAG: signal peptidase I [Clostridiales bacterium]|nr:signal peptidase I [Clostridiales bacterium]